MNTGFLPEIYEANLKLLKERFPDVHHRMHAHAAGIPFAAEPFVSPNGQFNVAVELADGNRVDFYGDSDIVGSIQAEMATWQPESEDFLFFVGVGLGYMPLLAVREFSCRPNIVVIEPEPAIFQLALRSIDLRQLFTYGRLDIYLGPDLPVSTIIANYGERLFFGKNRLVGHGPSRMILGGAFQSLENELVENIRIARNIGYTAKHAGKTIFSNTMQNLTSLFSGPDLTSLEGRFRGCPAICVAAGPSLDKDLSGLKEVGDRALILCCDSAVRALIKEGIVPHVVVTSDINPVNFEKLRTSLENLSESILVFSIEANPEIVAMFPGQRRVAVTAENAILNQWLGPKWSLQWRLPAMTSVSHSALFTALRLGADPIILVGMDFAFASGKSHASGSVFRYPSNTQNALEVEGVRGYPVYSLPQLVTDRRQIENVMAESRVRLIDTSLDGALIRGAENRSFKEVLDTLLQKNVAVSRVLDAIDWSPSVPGVAAAVEFQTMAGRFDQLISFCRAKKQACIFKTDPKASGAGNIARQTEKIRNALPLFEKKFANLLSLLKLIRYGDVKAIARRLGALKGGDKPLDDLKLHCLQEIEVYADYFASLEEAARHFKRQVRAAGTFFTGEAQALQQIESRPWDDGQILALADFYRSRGIFWKAESTFRRYIEKRPDDIEAWLNLGRMMTHKGLWSKARELARQMRRQLGDPVKTAAFETEVARGITKVRDCAADLIGAGAFEEARRKLQEYLSLSAADPCTQDIQEKLDAYDRENMRTTAQPETTGLSADRQQRLQEQVSNCLQMGEIEKAIGILEGWAGQGDAARWQVIERIGDVRLAQGDEVSAVWHYRRALELTPGDSSLVSKIQMADRSVRQGGQLLKNTMVENRQAETEAFGALDSAEAMYEKALAKAGDQALEDAVLILEHLLECYPDYALAHNDLGVLYYNMSRVDASFSHYKAAARLEPDNPVFQKNLADFYCIVKGDMQSALEIYVELLAKDPADREILFALGHICKEQDRLDDAAVFYRRILEIDPVNVDARDALASLAGETTEPANDPARRVTQETSPPLKKSESRETSGFPSPVITTDVVFNNRRYAIRIPEQEMFRVDNILDRKEYAVMDKRRGNGTYNVFDVGANVGLFALSVHKAHPRARIYCFEPSPAAATLLEANVGGLPEMVIFKHGLYNRNMQVPMHIHQYNTGQNSIRFSGAHHTQSVSVQVMDAGRTFDELGLRHLDILKIDTEGCEVEILESLGDRLMMVDYILAEYHTEKDRRAIDQLLAGFHLFGCSSVMTGIGTVKYVHSSLV